MTYFGTRVTAKGSQQHKQNLKYKKLLGIGIMLQRWAILAAVWLCALGVPATATAQEEALCAEVRIEILQELTMERQGFEAIMRITNSLDTYSIEDINISVKGTDLFLTLISS